MIYTFTIQCTTLSHNVRADAIRSYGWRVPFNRVLLKLPKLPWFGVTYRHRAGEKTNISVQRTKRH